MANGFADISIDEAKARLWMYEVRAELNAVDSVLKKVTEEAQSIPGNDDTIMQGIEGACIKLQDAWNSMIDGFKRVDDIVVEAVESIGKSGQKLLDMIDDFASRIKR